MIGLLVAARVGERVLVVTRGGEKVAESFGANAVAIRGDGGILLVDPLVAPSEAAAVERAAGGAPLAVVVTHHHTDHALGAGLFSRRAVRVLASRRCAEEMARQHPAIVASRRADPAIARLFADAEPYAPEAVDSAVRLDLGGLTALVRPVGPAHTPGDLVVEIPEERVLVAGDLVSNGYHVNYEEADLAGYEAALAAELSRAPRHVIPGHGAPGGPELIEAALAYHRAVRDAVRAGATPERLAAAYPRHRLAAVLPDTVRAFRAARS